MVPETNLLLESDLSYSHAEQMPVQMLKLTSIVAEARGWTAEQTVQITTANALAFFASIAPLPLTPLPLETAAPDMGGSNALIILVCGRSGSGKSSLAAAIVDSAAAAGGKSALIQQDQFFTQPFLA